MSSNSASRFASATSIMALSMTSADNLAQRIPLSVLQKSRMACVGLPRGM